MAMVLRRLALLSVVSGSLVGLVAGGATAAPAANLVPPAALAAVQSLFSLDADAQLARNTAATSPGNNVTDRAVEQLASLINRDRAAALYTASFGFEWDSHVTHVSVDSATFTTPASIELGVSVENRFHIAGMPADNSLDHLSITVDPYVLGLRRASDGVWRVSSFDSVPAPPQGTAWVSPSDPPTSLQTIRRNGESLTVHSSRKLLKSAAGTYYPSLAHSYAQTWWNGFNPAYTQYGNDCQNFVSQAIYAGGVALDYWHAWAPDMQAWYNTVPFKDFADNYGPFWPPYLIGSPFNGSNGDVLEINWTGGAWPNHAMLIVDKVNGVPLLAAHTNPRWNYPFTNIAIDYPNAAYWVYHPYAATR